MVFNSATTAMGAIAMWHSLAVKVILFPLFVINTTILTLLDFITPINMYKELTFINFSHNIVIRGIIGAYKRWTNSIFWWLLLKGNLLYVLLLRYDKLQHTKHVIQGEKWCSWWTSNGKHSGSGYISLFKFIEVKLPSPGSFPKHFNSKSAQISFKNSFMANVFWKVILLSCLFISQ